MPTEATECYCPFGCKAGDLKDERMYCRHLMGFTNDGETFEQLEAVMTKAKLVDGEMTKPEFVRWRVNGKKLRKVQPGDKLVNPEYQQLVDGVWHTAKMWVSARVYRNVPKLAESEPDDEQLEQMTAPAGAA